LAGDADWTKGLEKTRQSIFGRMGALLRGGEITADLWDELEALMIQADVGVSTTLEILDHVKSRIKAEGVRNRSGVLQLLKAEMAHTLTAATPLNDRNKTLTVILVVGVNGSGKTTSIAKLARHYQAQGRKVILAAADTFRAAAIDQLKIWGERIGVEVIAQQPGSDPGAVVFDAIQACRSRNADLLIVDTAGRLHTKFNLMEELRKIRGVASKQAHQAPHETFLVLDATTGQNALNQARHFKEAAQVTGVIVAKLDGTAKGGVVLSVVKELGVPVRFVGLGEKMSDFAVFDATRFVDGLFASAD
jgi:fused signal recognition particle receptor